MSFLDDMLNPKQNKEANLIPQGTDAQDHFERKLAASNWIEGVSALDVDAVEAEYQAKLAAEAKLLGKTAAQEFTTPEQVIESDYARQIKAYSDSNLMELLALARAHKDNVTAEQFAEYKEKAKANVESGRAKCEEELLKLTGEHTLLDWKAAFKKFSEEAKIEQPAEKKLYAPEVPEKHHDFDAPAESKFKMPTKEEMVPAGNGREEDERKEVTKEAVPVVKEASQKVADKVTDSPANKTEPIAMPEGKKSAGDKPVESVEESTILSSPKEIGDKDDQAMEGNSPEKGDKAKDIESVNKEAHCGSCPGDPGVKTAEVCDLCKGQAQKEDWVYCPKCKPMPEQKKADGPSASDNCPVCGSEGQDLMNGQADSIACQACGITYAPSEIKACASKAETIKKVAELSKKSEVSSPWVVIKDESGQDVIARVTPDLKKESEEKKDEEIQK
jgi:hypothetical protein